MSEEAEDVEIVVAPAPDAAAKAARRLSDAEFSEARELYELGTSGLADLADTYGISRQALSRRFKDAGAVKGSRAHELAAAAKKAAAGGPSAAGVAAIERFADRRPGWIEETRLQGYGALKMVQQLAQKLVADNMRKSTPPPPMSTIDDDLKAVQRLGKILADNLDARMRLLDADNYTAEEDLPSLRIEDVTDDEILEVFKNNGLMPEGATLEDMENDRRELEAVLEGDL